MKADKRPARPILRALVIALVSGGLILGIFSLSMMEGRIFTDRSASPSEAATTGVPDTPLVDITTTMAPPVWTATWTATLPPTPSNCPPPANWMPYVVAAGDTLDLLAVRYKVSVQDLIVNNCLGTQALTPGTTIYVPPLPTATPTRTKTPAVCTHPAGWVEYYVKAGDHLYQIAISYGLTLTELQIANCIVDPNQLSIGQKLYVPWWGTITPTHTLIYPVTDTPVPSETPTPSETPWPSDTPIPSETPTSTDLP